MIQARDCRWGVLAACPHILCWCVQQSFEWRESMASTLVGHLICEWVAEAAGPSPQHIFGRETDRQPDVSIERLIARHADIRSEDMLCITPMSLGRGAHTTAQAGDSFSNVGSCGDRGIKEAAHQLAICTWVF